MDRKKTITIEQSLDIALNEEFEELAVKGLGGCEILMQQLLRSNSIELAIKYAHVWGYIQCLSVLDLIDQQSVRELERHVDSMVTLRQKMLKT